MEIFKKPIKQNKSSYLTFFLNKYLFMRNNMCKNGFKEIVGDIFIEGMCMKVFSKQESFGLYCFTKKLMQIQSM